MAWLRRWRQPWWWRSSPISGDGRNCCARSRCDSSLKARVRPHIISSSTAENGSEASTTADFKASMLPASSSPAVSTAITVPQNTRSQRGPSSSGEPPCEDSVDSTTAPESADVTKKMKLTSTVNAITALLHG